MGFYLELTPSPEGGEYREREIPPVFWALLVFAGLALSGMAAAAFTLLKDLALGDWLDRALVTAIAAFIPAYLCLAGKLLWARKYVRFRGSFLETGFQFGGSRLFQKRVPRDSIRGIEVVNERRAQNVAPKIHDDKQYYIRGHWRIIVETDRSRLVVDRHTEKGALEALVRDLRNWWKKA